jgi:uncharacterized protein
VIKKACCPVTVEPRVEDLLASIRKAIDDDLGGGSSTSGNSQGTLMRGALREMRVSYDGDAKQREADSEISKLRDRIGRSRIQSAIADPHPLPPRFATAATSLKPARNGFSSILAGEGRNALPPPPLRQTLADDDLYESLETEQAQGFEEPATEEIWAEPQQAYVPPPSPYYPPEAYAPQAALVSPQTAYQAQNSFQELADSIMMRATGDRGLENMTQDLLRGMLKNWLDDNLPDMVERLVREEIERVARRGR